jgi:hypothetical protein
MAKLDGYDKFNNVLAYFDKGRFKNCLKANTHHPIGISIMVAANADFISLELRTN